MTIARKKQKTTFSWWLKLHIYGGLYCSIYFIIIGLTAFDYQHHIFNHEPVFVQTFEYELKLDHKLDNDRLITMVVDSLGLYGGIPWWKTWQDKEKNILHFEVNRPGKHYKLIVKKNDNVVVLNEHNRGLGNVLSGLHTGSGGHPERLLFKVWNWYALSATILGFFLIVTSIYFWFRKSVKKRWQWLTVAAAGSISILLILFVWLIG